VGIGFIATGLACNKDAFAKNGWKTPTSWQDLTDPKYKQKVVIPPITDGYGLLTLVMMSRLHGGGEEKMDPGFDVMTRKVVFGPDRVNALISPNCDVINAKRAGTGPTERARARTSRCAAAPNAAAAGAHPPLPRHAVPAARLDHRSRR